MTKDELEKATGQELIDARDYCGVDGYYGEYLNDVNAEMLKRFERLAELEEQIKKMAKEYEEKAECVEVDDYGKKVYGSIDIEQAFLAGLKIGRPK